MSILSSTRQKLNETVNQAAHSPEYLARLVVVYTTLVILLLPDLIAMALLLVDVFAPTLPGDPVSILFKGMVLFFVYALGTWIISVATAGHPEMDYILVLIGLILVVMGGVVIGRMSNSCVPDLACGSAKFTLGLVLSAGLTGLGYLMPLSARRRTAWYAVVYLAVSVWTAELWLYKAFTASGITPSIGALQGIILLIYAMGWVIVFMRMPGARPQPGVLDRR